MFRARRIWLTSAGVLALALATIAACQTPTSMTITVSTDVDCAALTDANTAHVVAGNPDDVVELLDPSSTKECEGSGQIGDLVLLPKEDENAAVGVKVILGVGRATAQCGTIVASAGDTEDEQRWGGCIVARRRLGFVEGEALLVDVPLHADCIGVPCSDTAFTTCVKGGRCVSGDIDPTDCLDDGCGEDDLPPTTGTSTGPTSGSSGSGTSGGGGGAAPDTASSTGQGGEGGEGGAAPACVDPERDCDELPECLVAVCVEGECSAEPQPLTTPCSGDRQCDGAGRCVACFEAVQCEAFECQEATCDEGACVYEDVAGKCDAGVCEDGICTTPDNCDNDVRDEDESDVDCGGSCPDCLLGENCDDGGDCVTDYCDGTVCAFCASDDQCERAQHCDDDGFCVDDVPNGGDCEQDEECAEGICTDEGLCCDVECDGPCQTCATTRCEAHDLGASPDSEDGCKDGVCDDGCDGGGACVFLDGNDEPCIDACSDEAERLAFCDGAGQCEEPQVTLCYPYVCDASEDACLAACDGDEDCFGTLECDAPICDEGCQYAFECPDPNIQCRVPACSSSECTLDDAPDGTACGTASCPARNQVSASSCSDGSCSSVELTFCVAYACENGACLTECDDDADCLDGRVCEAPNCVFPSTTSSSVASSSASSVASSSASSVASSSASSVASSSASSVASSTSSLVPEPMGGGGPVVIDGVGVGAGGDGGYDSVGLN